MINLNTAKVSLSPNSQLIVRIGGVIIVRQLTRPELEQVKRECGIVSGDGSVIIPERP